MHQSQIVNFSDCLDDGRSCILVELSEEIEELIDNCNENCFPELYFKGNEDEDAVLCTKSKTFGVKKVSTSNLLLFCRNLHDGIEVTAKLNCYIELIRMLPDSAILREKLLKSVPFRGQGGGRGVLHSLLADFFRGSDEELEMSLKKIGSVCIDNHWYIIDRTYADELLRYLTASVEAEGWSLNKIPCSLIHKILSEYGVIEQVENWIVDNFFEPLDPNAIAISSSKVARFASECILESATDKTLVLGTFLELWRKSVHSSLSIDLDMLKVE